MNINLHTLKQAIKTLPRPVNTGDYYTLKIINRVDELNMKTPHTSVIGSKPQNCKVSYKKVDLIAVPYCVDGRCWHEWELVL